MQGNMSQQRWTVELFNSKVIPNKQSNTFYCVFFRNLDILAVTSVLFSIVIYVCVMYVIYVCVSSILHLIIKR